MDIIGQIKHEQLTNSLSDEPITESDEFARQARATEAPHTFRTSRSGTTSPYHDTEVIGRVCADALALMGVTSEDNLLNFCAPRPHLSGMATVWGGEYLGTTILNDHFDEYERVIEAGTAADATGMVSIPSIAVSKAKEISERYGEPSEHFPNLDIGMIGGEIPRQSIREQIKSLWDIDRLREFYGSSETTLLAVGTDESRQLVPLLHRFVIEIEVDGKIVDIRDVRETCDGSILITHPGRKAVDLTRFRQGDRIRVHPGDEMPRIEPLGRDDDAINVDGALIHPADLFSALDELLDQNVLAVPVVRDADQPLSIEVCITGSSSIDRGAFVDELVRSNSALVHALEAAAEERIRITSVDSLDDHPVLSSIEFQPGTVVFESRL